MGGVLLILLSLAVTVYCAVSVMGMSPAGNDAVQLEEDAVNSFPECVEAGYEILYPDCEGCQLSCVTPDGRTFVNDVSGFSEPLR